MAYIKIDDTGRVTAASLTHHCGSGEIETTFPSGVSLENVHEYRFENGEWIHDPRPLPEPETPAPTDSQRIETLEQQMTALIGGVADVQ